MFFTCPPADVADHRAGLEDEHAQCRADVGQLAGDGRADRAGADHDDVVRLGHGTATAASASSSRLSMSCWARIWSKAL